MDPQQLLEEAEKLNGARKYSEVLNLLNDDLLSRHQNARLYTERANALRELEQPDKAQADCETAISIAPYFYLAYVYRGISWFDRNEVDKAIVDYSKAIELNPLDPVTFYKRANALNARKEHDRAIADYNRAIVLNPKFVRAYNNRGIAWDDKKEFDKAISDYTKAIELDPTFTLAYNNRALAYDNKQEYEKAIEDYNKTLELNPVYADAYNNRGALKAHKGEYQKAIEDYNKALTLKPNSAVAYRNRAEAWYELKEYALAINDYEKSLELEPQSFTARSGLDRSRAMLGQMVVPSEKNADESFYLFVKAVEELDYSEQREILFRSNLIMDTVVKTVRNYANTTEAKAVAHYTKLKVADILVSGAEPRLRYYNTVYMNDPEEGKILLDSLRSEAIRQAFERGEQKEDNNIYLGSFLPVERKDDLVMWRTYGKDENNVDAAGCCLVIDTQFFEKRGDLLNPGMRKTALNGTVDIPATATTPQFLHRVLYYNRSTGEFNGPAGKELKRDIELLRVALEQLLELKKENASHQRSVAIDKIVYHIISELRYFFKSADYAFENELRVIQFAPSDSDSVQIDDFAFPKKLYINSNKPVQQQINQIILGPKVPYPERWIYLEAAVKKKYHNHPIKLIKSDCRYQ